MTTPTPTLQAADGGPLTPGSVAAALSDEFSVGFGSAEVLRRTHLDTFDRRLHSAGLSLEHETDSSGQRLALSRQEASRTLTTEVAGTEWPALVGALPAGPVRDVLAPVVSIRALMVVGDEKRRVRRGELRNEDLKVVARLELDEPTRGAKSGPPRLTVRVLRGYAKDASRATRLLVAAGLQEVGRDQDAADLDGEPRRIPTDRSGPAIDLLVAELGEFAAAMRRNLPGLLDDVDTEFLHDFRVAVRRTRSTLKLGRAALPDAVSERWEPEFSWLGGLTTPVRDLDVYQLGLPTMAGWLVAAEAADLEPFAAQLRRRRARARRTLVRGLRSSRFQNLHAAWEQELTDLFGEGYPNPEHARLSAGDLAGRAITRAHRRVARGGAAIRPGSPAEALHSLRKRCKELRYALEVFAPVIDGAARKRAVADLKDLQGVLGRFQDSDVQRRALHGFAEEMVAAGAPAHALLAMGELVAHLDADQARARDEFDRAFARFDRPSGRRRMRLLGAGG